MTEGSWKGARQPAALGEVALDEEVGDEPRQK
jgi:hypothetical protein